MAVTQNSYVGNGSTTVYSFTFPYLKTADIKAQINATDTTAFTLPTATTLQFNTAPANGDKIKIYRKTSDDNLTATFYAGSSIKSEDLNDNFNQSLYITQEVNARYLSNLGGTMVGDMTMAEDVDIIFEGATDDAYETRLTTVDPTADRTISLPNESGTLVTTGSTNYVTSAHIVDGAVATADIADNAVDGNKIGDSVVNSEHYVDGSIDTEHIDDLQVTTAKLANTSVTTAKLAADAVDGTKIADDSINSEHYVDGSIDTAHIADDQVTADKLANTAVTAGSYTAADITVDAQGRITAAASGTIGTAEIAADAINADKIADNAVGTEHIADAELTTLAGMQSGTASILAGGTALAATLTEINTICDGKGVETTITNDDTKYPTSGAVVDYVAAQIAPIGGFEVVADEDNFPTTQPASGIVVSIKDASGIVINGSGVSTTARTAGNGSDNVTINNFPSDLHSQTLGAGVGLMVESTGSSHTYNYHKALIKESDLVQLSDDINDFNSRYRIASSAPGSSNDEGDLYFDTSSNKMFVYDGSAWGEVTSTGDFKYLFLCPTGGTGAPTIDGSVATYDLREGSNSGSTASVTNAAQLMVSINGVVQKPNTGTSAPSEGFAMVDVNTIIFGSNLPNGAEVFVVQSGSALAINVPGDNTVATAKIQNGAINTDKLGADAVIGSKIADDAVAQEHIADEAVNEARLQISNAGSNGQFLSKQSGNTGGLTWASVTSTPEGTAILSTGESGATKFLREDGDGSCSWQTVQGATAGGVMYENDLTISSNHTIASTKGAHSVGPVTLNATVTVNGRWVIS